MKSVLDTPVFEAIDLGRIDSENLFFKIRFEPSLSLNLSDTASDALKTSIQRIGLVSPPIIKFQPDNPYVIVSGFRRISACRELGFREISAHVLGGDSDDGHLMKLAIADNALNRPLNIIEQATAISKLLPFLPRDVAAWSPECRQIGLDVNPGLIGKLKKIHAAPEDLKERMAAGKISLTVGLELADMDDPARILFLTVFDALNPTLNHQKEMIRLSKEIARSEDRPVSEIITGLEIADIVIDPDMDRNRKISRARKQLKNRRYPEISRFEKTYRARAKRLPMPESIVLHPPADFEGNDFMIQASFRDLPHFKEICDNLLALRDHPDFAAILEKKSEDN